MSVPSAKEQYEIIRKLHCSTSITIEDGAYAISSDWYYNFRKSLGIIGRDGPTDAKLPEIDNNSIANKDGTLRADLNETQDYDVLTKGEWEQIYAWYGGGPIIKLKVVNDEADNPIAVTHFHEIQLSYNDKIEKVITNDYMPVSELIATTRKLFGLAEDFEIQLVEMLHGQINSVLDKDSMLARYKLRTGQKVLINYKDEEGNWKFDSKKEEKKEKNYIRTTIPRAASSGLRHSEGTPGQYGFSNLGNTCFFNSGTQCLMHTMPFIKDFVNDEWEKWINTTNKLGTGGRLATAFAITAKKMWSSSGEYCIRPSELKHAVGRFAPRFSGYEQHDSHELIMFMLDGIHEDLNRCIDKPYIESVVGNGTDDQATADESWKRHKLRNDSIVVDNFHGLLRSELRCPKCKKTTVVFDPYLSIPLPLARENDRKLNIFFAPYDITQKWIPMQIVIRVTYLSNADVISNLISQKLGREIHVAPATLSQSGKNLKWGFSDNSDSYYYRQFLVAFEIPDLTKFYVPCYMMGQLQSRYTSTYYQRDVIATPFIVQCDADISNEDMSELVKERIKPLIKPKKATAAPKAEEQKTEENNTEEQKTEENNAEEQKAEENNAEEQKEEEKKEEEKKEEEEESEDDGIEVDDEVKDYIKRVKKEEGEFEGAFDKDIFSSYATARKSRIIPYCSQNTFKFSLDTTTVNFKLALMNFPTDGKADTKSPEAEKGVTLDKCFQLFEEPDVLDEMNQWYCPHCKDFVCAEKRLKVWNAPKILIIQIKRFTGSGYSIKKDNTLVDFPDTLDMSKYCQSHPEGVSQKYRLYAVSEHMGGLGGGHYIAHARVTTSTKDGGKWFCFDDSSCSPASPEAAHSPLAYVLFYQRIDEQ